MATKTSPCRPVESSLPMSDALQNPPRGGVDGAICPATASHASRRPGDDVSQPRVAGGQVGESVREDGGCERCGHAVHGVMRASFGHLRHRIHPLPGLSHHVSDTCKVPGTSAHPPPSAASHSARTCRASSRSRWRSFVLISTARRAKGSASGERLSQSKATAIR